ncbi:hypothetical protein E1A91_A01G065300v1 [Gossypium mustelinum]|uniref:Uncharacterized protein n=4 Tax=Gossypium TaxID=3633 RepID=A0A5J5NA91_GOSBA|nr:hypothetical protein ES319_1Z212500v1 [Gossypium barbadense]TYH30131.1 hypothetical protein ES288_A01G069300v1 [Gossypium darwinii]TYI42141.1 hypothetical protein ES332_A01G076600v1 [Gossypium tomentosum]TYJ48482.1 hypothetical protein E1A91_A01G065300v1 [Gossypium mustelinum]
MSNTCGNCDCSDKSQCVKKGSSNTMVIETEKRYICTFNSSMAFIPATKRTNIIHKILRSMLFL